MLKKVNRLGSKKLAGGNFFKTELFDIKVFKDPDGPKFGFSVSKKVSRSAVIRNKTKRILSKIVENNLDKIKPDTNIVIISKKIIDDKKQAEKVFLEILNKGSLLT